MLTVVFIYPKLMKTQPEKVRCTHWVSKALSAFPCHSSFYSPNLSTLPSLSSGLWAKSFWPLLEFWWTNWKFHLGFLRWRFLLAIFSSLHFSELFVYLSVCSASTRKWQLITCHGRRRHRRRRRCSIDALWRQQGCSWLPSWCGKSS